MTLRQFQTVITKTIKKTSLRLLKNKRERSEQKEQSLYYPVFLHATNSFNIQQDKQWTLSPVCVTIVTKENHYVLHILRVYL